MELVITLASGSLLYNYHEHTKATVKLQVFADVICRNFANIGQGNVMKIPFGL